jgi:hypothetical protein
MRDEKPILRTIESRAKEPKSGAFMNRNSLGSSDSDVYLNSEDSFN